MCEVRPRLVFEEGLWKCSCDKSLGFGETAAVAHLEWLRKFEYKGPELPRQMSGEIQNADNFR